MNMIIPKTVETFFFYKITFVIVQIIVHIDMSIPKIVMPYF